MKSLILLIIVFFTIPLILLIIDFQQNRAQLSNQQNSTQVNFQFTASPASVKKESNFLKITDLLLINLDEIKKQQPQYTLVLDKEEYLIIINAFSNFCPLDDSRYRCEAKEKSLSNIKKTLLWQENRNTFAINPLKIDLQGQIINNLVIMKVDQSYFSPDEIDLWFDILERKLEIVKKSSN